MKVEGTIHFTHIEKAKERLILARSTHFDSLVSKLAEPHVRRVIEPILAGGTTDADVMFNDDVSYVVDLGLVKSQPLRMANPIYTEVVARVLAAPAQETVTADPRTFVRADGRFDIDVLLREFASFWVEQGDTLTESITYREAGAQLVLMAFLQRIVNGGGTVSREFGIGSRRIDLLLTWPYADTAGKRQVQREAIELKVWRDGRKDPLAEGLIQIEHYLDKVGLDHGVLILFDRRSNAAARGTHPRGGGHHRQGSTDPRPTRVRHSRRIVSKTRRGTLPAMSPLLTVRWVFLPCVLSLVFVVSCGTSNEALVDAAANDAAMNQDASMADAGLDGALLDASESMLDASMLDASEDVMDASNGSTRTTTVLAVWPHAQNVAIDSTTLYFGSAARPGGSPGIGAVPLEGGPTRTLFAGETTAARNFVLSPSRLFWGRDTYGDIWGDLWSGPHAGGSVNREINCSRLSREADDWGLYCFYSRYQTGLRFVAQLNTSDPRSVRVQGSVWVPDHGFAAAVRTDSSRVYWVNRTTKRLMAVNRDGTGRSVLASVPPSGHGRPGAFVLDATNAYVLTDEGIVRVPLAGGEATWLLPITPVTQAPGDLNDIVIDGETLYWSTTFSLHKVQITGEQSETLLSFHSCLSGSIAVDATSVYFANGCAGLIETVAK